MEIRARLYLIFTVVLIIPSPFTLGQDNGDDTPIVDTTLGKIQGKILTTFHGKEFYSYRGIRYAKAPIDELRFKPPEPVEPWNDTLKASSDSLVCPQSGALQIVMSEDCLKLNVFTKDLKAKLPVIVYIHGGANVLGSGHSLYEAGPHYFMDHEVVMVAFNYRLGALGFLSTQTPEYPGNYGFLDQVLALQWVRQHIHNFGGDPDNVTIFGMSAGSMAVTLHMASPLSKGLFHRAIAMSGSATNHYHIDNIYWTRKLARELSCPQYNPVDMVECLREISWKTIVNKCSEWEPYKFTNMKWNYEIDGKFLPEHPTEIFAKGEFNKVPLLVGFTKNELDFSTHHQENNSRLLNDVSVSFDLYAPELFLYKTEEQASNSISSRIWNFYMGAESSVIDKTNLIQFGEMFSDSILGHGIHRLVELTYKHVPVYYYRMDYKGSRSSLYVDAMGEPRGVGHADDIQYVMPGLWYGTQFAENHSDAFMVDRITQWWTSFATNGTPIAHNVPEWQACEGAILTMLNDREAAMTTEQLYSQRYLLWDDLFPISKSSAATTNLVANLIAMKFITILVIINLIVW